MEIFRQIYLCTNVYQPLYLDSFIHIEYQLAGVADQEDDDDGEEHGHHGGVTPVVPCHPVVEPISS